MIKPWHLLPIVIVGCLGGAAAWWDDQHAFWIAPQPKVPDVPIIENIETPSAPHLQSARERPVFWSSRRVKVVVVKDTTQIDILAQARLLSVVQTGGLSVGWLRKKDGTLLKLTSDSAPWRIESFDGRVAKLIAGDGERYDLSLETSRAR